MVVEIDYLRPPAARTLLRQELLLDSPQVKLTLQPVGREGLPLGGTHVPEGGAVLWFTFPGRAYEVAAVHAPDGRLLGWYTNVVRPPKIRGRRWRIVDLFLDVWQEPGGEARLLDRSELERAREEGWIEPAEAGRAEETARRVLSAAREGSWPPEPVRRWSPETVPALRFRRDAPGLYHANLVSGRIIAFGIYTLGAVSLVSVAFAAFTDAFERPGPSQTAWLVAIAAVASLLLPFALAGRLPATGTPRPREALSERTLFIGTLVMGVALLLLRDRSEWRGGLLGVYATLGLFLLIFATCRALFDREVPALALAGLLVCGVAFALLI